MKITDQLQELKNINGNDAKASYQKIRKYGLTVGDTKEEFLSDVMALWLFIKNWKKIFLRFRLENRNDIAYKI